MAYPITALGIVTVATSGTPVNLSANQLFARSFSVQGYKAKGTANTGIVHIEDENANLVLELAAGAQFTFPASGRDREYDLSKFQADAVTNGDGVLVTILP